MTMPSQSKQALQAAVRQVADEYLSDPNITSVGLGYKVTDGERSDVLALQFTVGKKVHLEELQALPTRPIPDEVTANGMTFQTDVVERTFKPHAVVQETGTKDERKRRLDPMQPGVSIGNFRSTAGTLGCLVQDIATGELRLLSNWHVFQGDTGRLGDAIVQPGPYDDNRVDADRVGLLERSFLGLAGDCALATISGRGVREDILGLDVAVREVRDPDLSEVVVKSGRTTGVTYGVVTRIHTITKLDYGALGEQRIGGFEIGPDASRPAENNEISMGGDSGSAWMAVDQDGAATETMAGLHFAGETVEPAEYALSCYASSVFEKLEVRPVPAPPMRAVDGAVAAPLDQVVATGYDPTFLTGQTILMPVPVGDAADDLAPTKSGDLVRHYTHYSLSMSRSRRFARWVAWNVDGGAIKKYGRKGLEFVLDDAYEARYQVDDELYSKNRLDRGHIARRADLVWGSAAEAKRGNVDSFFFTNITPQLDDFNQGKMHGLWGRLEDAIYADVDVDDLRVAIMGGPILKPTDLPYRDVLVPRSFWKVIAYVEGGTLKAKAYVLTQDDLEAKLESLGLEEFKVYQVRLADLGARTSLDFGDLVQHDTMPPAPEGVDVQAVRRVTSDAEVVAD